MAVGILSTVLMLTGCGSSNDTSASIATEDAVESEYGYYTEYNKMEMAEEASDEQSDSASSIAVKEQNRKLIKTYHLSVETIEFSTLVDAVRTNVEALGGYIENSEIYTESYQNVQRGDFTIRVPKDKAQHFLSVVEDNSNLTSISENVEDVTLSYVDLESHKKALLTEQDRLLELIEQAETIEDLIYIEERLSQVRYEIGSMESQLRTYDNKIDYTTIYLYVKEVKRVTEPEEDSFLGKVSTRFKDNLIDVCENLVDFTIWFISSIPYFIVWAIIIIIVVKGWKLLRKRRGNKNWTFIVRRDKNKKKDDKDGGNDESTV